MLDAAGYKMPPHRGFTNEWFDYAPYQGSVSLKIRLEKFLEKYTNLGFDHLQVGYTDGNRQVCVFVVKGSQSAVLYDRVKRFPSVKLLASLVLLGS